MIQLGFDLDQTSSKDLINSVDKKGNGQINVEDFINVLIEGTTEEDIQDEISKSFRLFDENQKGGISFGDIKRVATELADPLTDLEIHEIIEEADRGGSG